MSFWELRALTRPPFCTCHIQFLVLHLILDLIFKLLLSHFSELLYSISSMDLLEHEGVQFLFFYIRILAVRNIL